MKKLGFFILGLVLFAVTATAQIEVGTNNNVAVGITGNVDSKFAVKSVGLPKWSGYFYQDNPGGSYGALYARKEISTVSSSYAYAIYGYAVSGQGYAIGLQGVASNATPSSYGRAYGVRAFAGNATPGYNYAVRAELSGSNNGAAIFGTTGSDYNTGGKYAGYFYGQTKVNGTFYVGESNVTSDKKAKKEIKNLEKNNIAKLKKVKAIKYKYKTPLELGLGSEITDTAEFYISPDMQDFYNRERIGLEA